MSDKRKKHIFRCNSKPIEMMTPEERDERFKSLYGLTYAEWCEKYKDDTLEKIESDMDKHIKTI